MLKRLFLMLCLAGSFAFAQNLKVNNSKIQWKAYKALNADSFSHFGTVKLKAGNVVMNNNQLSGGNFIIDMNSLVADDMKGDKKLKPMLENHLKSDDFFDVKKYPTVFFKITSVKPSSDKNYNSTVSGNLTIKNVTKTISFPANITYNEKTVNFTSKTFTFNRQDFGLTYNVFEDMIIKNDVEMNVNFTAKYSHWRMFSNSVLFSTFV